MTGDKFNPDEYRTDKPWNPTPTTWADWPTVKEPQPQTDRRVVGYAVAGVVVLLLLSCVWPLAAGILGVFLAVFVVVGRS